jgi:hypothetical protein
MLMYYHIFVFVQLTDSVGLNQQSTNEELKPVDAIVSKIKVSDDINIQLKNMAAIMQKGLMELGYQQNKDEKESIRDLKNVTLRSKVRLV